MAPRYHLDLFNLSGISGFGRFVLITDRETLFLDMCRHVETDYTDGELRYVLRDRLLGGGEIRISFVPAADAAGLLIEADLSEVPDGAQVWFLHGGMYGWNAHSTYLLPYSSAMCWDNTVTLLGDTAEVCLGETETAPDYEYRTCGWTAERARGARVPSYKIRKARQDGRLAPICVPSVCHTPWGPGSFSSPDPGCPM